MPLYYSHLRPSSFYTGWNNEELFIHIGKHFDQYRGPQVHTGTGWLYTWQRDGVSNTHKGWVIAEQLACSAKETPNLLLPSIALTTQSINLHGLSMELDGSKR